MKRLPTLAFSLVEVLAAITIIGIIVFLAVPNIVQVKQDGEDNLARARAETLNMAIAALIQNQGASAAESAWTANATSDYKYGMLRPYMAFSESNLAAFLPAGYSVTFPNSINPPSKVGLTGPSGNLPY